MKLKTALLAVCMVALAAAKAQVGSDFIHNTVFTSPNLMNTVLMPNTIFCGVFGPDTPDSEFLFVTREIKRSEETYVYELTGKNWHKGITTPCSGYVKFVTLKLYDDGSVIDSVNCSPAGLAEFDSLAAAGWKIHDANGLFEIMENDSVPYSGRFKGFFKVYFMFNATLNRTAGIPSKLILKEPSHVFTGTWTMNKGAAGTWAPFFWSSLQPIRMKNNDRMLPDLRMNSDGSINSGNWVIIPGTASWAHPDWAK
jgi:hypothetical protein